MTFPMQSARRFAREPRPSRTSQGVGRNIAAVARWVCERGSRPWSVRSGSLKTNDGLGISRSRITRRGSDVLVTRSCRLVVVAPGNQTASSNFGHSSARVPEWLHIGAYPHAFPDRARLRRRCEIPANKPIHYQLGSEIRLIAMQKVEGSNPFSRFSRIPCMIRAGVHSCGWA